MVRRRWLAHMDFPLAPGATWELLAQFAHVPGPALKVLTCFPVALSVAKRSRSVADRIAKPSRRKGFVLACAALCACTLVLGGCMHATKAHFVRHYTLSAAASPPNEQNGTPRASGRILQIARIVVPDWLDGTAMYYRLDYERDGRLASYANSDWIAPPATLLEPLLENTIRSGGGWRAVIGPRDPASADVTLQIRLDDFSQGFSQAQQSAAVLDATATLISNRDEHVIAQRHFEVESAAPTADAQGGAKALGDASAKFAAQLRQWVERAAASNQ